MKKTIALLLCITALTAAQAQTPTDSLKAKPDTTRAIQIIDRYLHMVDFSRIRNDSMLCVETHAVDRNYPDDTMFIYRWYLPGNRVRIEMWQGGKMEDAYYSDGKKLFRKFSNNTREWRDVTQISFYDLTEPLDIRGALYDWRSKGAEPQYMGRMDYKGQPVDRVFVASPNMFDRNYFFETTTGLLFIVTEDEHIYGDAKKAKNAQRVDWRGWSEFTPLRGCLMPSIESYQSEGQIVISKHYYHFEAPKPTLFTEDFRKR